MTFLKGAIKSHKSFFRLLFMAIKGTFKPLLTYSDICKDIFFVLTLTFALGSSGMANLVAHIGPLTLTFSETVSINSIYFL